MNKWVFMYFALAITSLNLLRLIWFCGFISNCIKYLHLTLFIHTSNWFVDFYNSHLLSFSIISHHHTYKHNWINDDADSLIFNFRGNYLIYGFWEWAAGEKISSLLCGDYCSKFTNFITSKKINFTVPLFVVIQQKCNNYKCEKFLFQLFWFYMASTTIIVVVIWRGLHLL